MSTYPPLGEPVKSGARILFYALRLDGGGAERVTSLLIGGLVRRGYEAVVVTQHPPGTEVDMLPADIRRHVVGLVHAPAVLRLARILRAERPDVVISTLSTCNLEAMLAASLAGMPRRLVQTVHGFPEAERGFLSQLAFRLLPFSSRLAAATIAVSDALRAHLVGAFHADPRRTIRVYNPIVIDADAPVPDAAALAARPPLVLAIGRLEKVKDLPTLLRAFALLPDRRARLALLGEGSERQALERLAAELGIADRVDMPGWIGDVGPWLDRAACLAVSSISESFALTLVEAMARGVPVVSTDSPGPREILADGRYGALVPTGDVGALAAALAATLAERGDPSARIARARTFALEPTLDRWEEIVARIAPLPVAIAPQACADAAMTLRACSEKVE